MPAQFYTIVALSAAFALLALVMLWFDQRAT